MSGKTRSGGGQSVIIVFRIYVMPSVVFWVHLRTLAINMSVSCVVFESYTVGMIYKDVQTIDSNQVFGTETGASQGYSPTQAGAMSYAQALRVHQIRERGKQMDEKYLTEVGCTTKLLECYFHYICKSRPLPSKKKIELIFTLLQFQIEQGVLRLGELAKDVNQEMKTQHRMLDDLENKLDT